MNSKIAFEALHLNSNASIDQIKTAYRNLSLQCHPDRNENLNDKFLKIKRAYQFLLGLNEPEVTAPKPIKQPAPNEHKLELSLEEIFSGCTKQQKITRKVFDAAGNEKREEKSLTIHVKPGLLNETRITVDKEGDRYYGKTPANVVFVVHQKIHPIFTRIRFDLKYTAKITPDEALLGCALNIPTLENDTIQLQIPGNVNEKSVRQIANRGMPYPNSPGKRGNLIVTFDIVEQVKTIEKELYLTLNQILNGCSKNIKINRKIIDFDGTENFEDKLLTVEIKPGTLNETRITFPQEGDKTPNGFYSDVVFIIRDKPNEQFKRDRHDIIHTAQITLNEAIEGTSLSIPTLESIPIKFKIDGPLNPEGYRIVNKGLPHVDDELKRGDLVIQFELMKKDPPTEKELFLTLEEIFTGCLKQIDHDRKVVNQFGNETIEHRILEVKIDPGVEDGTRIVIPRMSDHYFGTIPADLVLIVRDKPHNIFTRNRADIEFIAKVTQTKLNNRESIEIPTLIYEKRQFLLDETIKSKTIKKIVNCGLPYVNVPEKHGDILVRFEIIQDKIKVKDPDIEYPLSLTLKNILNGCTKKSKINRKFINAKGEMDLEDKIVTLDIKPGTIEGTKFRFHNHGNESHETIPADVVFVAQDKPHKTFRRIGADVIYTALITKREASNGIELEIPTLEEGKTKLIKLTNLIESLKNAKLFKGEGLPKTDNPNLRGDLIVNVEIVNENHKEPATEHKVDISLVDVLNGCVKKMKINQTVIDLNGSEKHVDKIVDINIPPGIKSGERYTFPRLGKFRLGKICGDLVFVVTVKEHEKFTRNGYDIEYNAKISENDAKIGFDLQIPTLEGGFKTLSINKTISKFTTKTLNGLGLPFQSQPNMRGNLIVRFVVV